MINSRIFSTSVLTVMLLTGCATNQSNMSSTTPTCTDHLSTAPVDNTLQGQSNQFSGDLFDCKMTERLKTIGADALIGAGIGALGGAVGAKIAGVDPALGAAIGAGVGALAGAAYGNMAADRNESAEEIELTKQAITVLQQENRKLANYVIQAEITIAADDKKFEKIKRDLRKRRLSKNKAIDAVEKLNANRKALQVALTDLKKRKDEVSKKLPKNNQSLTPEIEKYQTQINALEKLVANTPERNLSAPA